MLLVTGILSMLAAVLLPALASARSAGRQAVCLSNLRQLTVAHLIYAADHDDRLADAGWVYVPPGAGWVYTPRPYMIDVEAGALYPFVGDWRIYECPDWRGHPSYSMNSFVALAPLAEIERPAATLLLVEEDAASILGHGPNDGVFVGGYQQDLLAMRHSGGCNMAYCDGHAKWIEPRRLRPALGGLPVGDFIGDH